MPIKTQKKSTKPVAYTQSDPGAITDQEASKLQWADNGDQKELGGRQGLDPTRYGDWEKNGRCVDF